MSSLMPAAIIGASQRVKNLAPSPTVAVSERARQMKSEGVDVIDLGGGDPDFKTPDHICTALNQALAAGETHYVATAGTAALRESIARKLLRDNRLSINPASEVLVTPGAKAALFQAMLAFVEPGVDVMVLEPAWVSYRPMIEIAGGRPVAVALSPKNNYQITRHLLEFSLTPQTRILLVNSPNNPTGRVLTVEEAQQVAAFAVEHQLLVFSDEIYEKILYDRRHHICLAALPGMASRTLTFNGFSKSYAMTGWRLGYVAGPADLIKQITKIHTHSTTCVTSFAQAGGVAALEGPQDFVGEMVAHWDRRRQAICGGLSKIKGIRCPLPEGAFYAMADIEDTGFDSTTFAEKLLQEARVAVTPGIAFGRASAHQIRLSFATRDEDLQKAVERIGHCL